MLLYLAIELLAVCNCPNKMPVLSIATCRYGSQCIVAHNKSSWNC